MGQNGVKLHLAELTKNLTGRPYALNDPRGLDCFSSVREYLIMRGVEIPDEFDGHSVQDYKALFISDPDTAKKLMVKLVESLLDEIRPAFTLAGDILLAKHIDTFLAINGGNGFMLGATIEVGMVPLPMRAYKILRAFRVRTT